MIPGRFSKQDNNQHYIKYYRQYGKRYYDQCDKQCDKRDDKQEYKQVNKYETIKNKYETIIEDKIYKVFYSSPIGLIKITGIESGILGVEFTDTKDQVNMNRVAEDLPEQIEGLPEQVIICREQLDEYFKGKRRNFSLDIVFTKGTDFQKKVWKALLKIPYGKTSSYGEIAKAINNEKAARAVGNANNKNPISIIIPCHRVIGSNGRLVGYGGGLWRKKWLLEHERNNTIQ